MGNNDKQQKVTDKYYKDLEDWQRRWKERAAARERAIEELYQQALKDLEKRQKQRTQSSPKDDDEKNKQKKEKKQEEVKKRPSSCPPCPVCEKSDTPLPQDEKNNALCPEEVEDPRENCSVEDLHPLKQEDPCAGKCPNKTYFKVIVVDNRGRLGELPRIEDEEFYYRIYLRHKELEEIKRRQCQVPEGRQLEIKRRQCEVPERRQLDCPRRNQDQKEPQNTKLCQCQRRNYNRSCPSDLCFQEIKKMPSDDSDAEYNSWLAELQEIKSTCKKQEAVAYCNRGVYPWDSKETYLFKEIKDAERSTPKKKKNLKFNDREPEKCESPREQQHFVCTKTKTGPVVEYDDSSDWETPVTTPAKPQPPPLPNDTYGPSKPANQAKSKQTNDRTGREEYSQDKNRQKSIYKSSNWETVTRENRGRPYMPSYNIIQPNLDPKNNEVRVNVDASLSLNDSHQYKTKVNLSNQPGYNENSPAQSSRPRFSIDGTVEYKSTGNYPKGPPPRRYSEVQRNSLRNSHNAPRVSWRPSVTTVRDRSSMSTPKKDAKNSKRASKGKNRKSSKTNPEQETPETSKYEVEHTDDSDDEKSEIEQDTVEQRQDEILNTPRASNRAMVCTRMHGRRPQERKIVLVRPIPPGTTETISSQKQEPPPQVTDSLYCPYRTENKPSGSCPVYQRTCEVAAYPIQEGCRQRPDSTTKSECPFSQKCENITDSPNSCQRPCKLNNYCREECTPTMKPTSSKCPFTERCAANTSTKRPCQLTNQGGCQQTSEPQTSKCPCTERCETNNASSSCVRKPCDLSGCVTKDTKPIPVQRTCPFNQRPFVPQSTSQKPCHITSCSTNGICKANEARPASNKCPCSKASCAIQKEVQSPCGLTGYRVSNCKPVEPIQNQNKCSYTQRPCDSTPSNIPNITKSYEPNSTQNISYQSTNNVCACRKRHSEENSCVTCPKRPRYSELDTTGLCSRQENSCSPCDTNGRCNFNTQGEDFRSNKYQARSQQNCPYGQSNQNSQKPCASTTFSGQDNYNRMQCPDTANTCPKSCDTTVTLDRSTFNPGNSNRVENYSSYRSPFSNQPTSTVHPNSQNQWTENYQTSFLQRTDQNQTRQRSEQTSSYGQVPYNPYQSRSETTKMSIPNEQTIIYGGNQDQAVPSQCNRPTCIVRPRTPSLPSNQLNNTVQYHENAPSYPKPVGQNYENNCITCYRTQNNPYPRSNICQCPHEKNRIDSIPTQQQEYSMNQHYNQDTCTSQPNTYGNTRYGLCGDKIMNSTAISNTCNDTAMDWDVSCIPEPNEEELSCYEVELPDSNQINRIDQR